MPQDFFDVNDLYKAIFSVTAGFVLGLERELKDKKAGLKTISVICLGATLFTIVSQRVGGENNAGQIAAYIVSGVGFIGAGAIFKEGFSITGLTTAGIVWMAAAVGTSIGFGEYYTAGIFLVASYVAVIVLPFVVGRFTSKKSTKKLEVHIKNNDTMPEAALIAFLKTICIYYEVKSINRSSDSVKLVCEIFLPETKEQTLRQFLETETGIGVFTIENG
jgi:putative Mg2+ transporter-C (MgtC) family protein